MFSKILSSRIQPISKESFKQLSPTEKEQLIAAFTRESLFASDDVQNLLNYVADVIDIVKQVPTIKVDYSRLVDSINNKPADPASLDTIKA
jgi:hypothetical protein